MHRLANRCRSTKSSVYEEDDDGGGDGDDNDDDDGDGDDMSAPSHLFDATIVIAFCKCSAIHQLDNFVKKSINFCFYVCSPTNKIAIFIV